MVIENESAPSNPDWNLLSSVVRRHVHDVRNRLNGIEMEASLLEEVETDPMAQDSINRLRTEMGRLESNLRALSARFVDPKCSAFSVIDLFNLWRTRSNCLTTDMPVHWECQSESCEVEVDARVVADALGECLQYGGSGEIYASVRSDEAGVVFEIRETEQKSQDDAMEVKRLPGIEMVFERNGGTFDRTFHEARREWVTLCRFPRYEPQ